MAASEESQDTDFHCRIDNAIGDLHVEGFEVEMVSDSGIEAVVQESGCANYLEFLVRQSGLLRQVGVTAIRITFEDQRQRLNGDGFFYIHPNDCVGFSREKLCTTLGIAFDGDEDTLRDLSSQAPAPPRVRERMRSQLLGALRLLDPILPPHTANDVARKFSLKAAIQLDEETEAAQGQRDRIAAWYLARAGRLLTRNNLPVQNLTARPTDSLHTKFNVFDHRGEYIGYSLKISPLPPFRLTLMRSEKIEGRWKTTVVLDKAVSDIASSFKGQER